MSTSPIYPLVDAVETAIREYDRTNDHRRHERGADCIRCRLVEALPPYARDRIERSKTLSRATGGAAVDVVREAATENPGRALLRRAVPMLVRLGDFIGNGPIDATRAASLGERCDLLGDIRKELAR